MSDRQVVGKAFDADVRGQSVEADALDAGTVNTDAWETDNLDPANPRLRTKNQVKLEAEDVAIQDAGGYFTTNNVEAALQELAGSLEVVGTAGHSIAAGTPVGFAFGKVWKVGDVILKSSEQVNGSHACGLYYVCVRGVGYASSDGDERRFCVAWCDTTDSKTYLRSGLYKFSTNTITWDGNPHQILANNATWINLHIVVGPGQPTTSFRAFVSLKDETANTGKVIVAYWASGTGWTTEDTETFNAANTEHIVVMQYNLSFWFVFKDTGGSGFGCIRYGSYSTSTKVFTWGTKFTFVSSALTASAKSLAALLWHSGGAYYVIISYAAAASTAVMVVSGTTTITSALAAITLEPATSSSCLLSMEWLPENCVGISYCVTSPNAANKFHYMRWNAQDVQLSRLWGENNSRTGGSYLQTDGGNKPIHEMRRLFSWPDMFMGALIGNTYIYLWRLVDGIPSNMGILSEVNGMYNYGGPISGWGDDYYRGDQIYILGYPKGFIAPYQANLQIFLVVRYAGVAANAASAGEPVKVVLSGVVTGISNVRSQGVPVFCDYHTFSKYLTTVDGEDYDKDWRYLVKRHLVGTSLAEGTVFLHGGHE